MCLKATLLPVLLVLGMHCPAQHAGLPVVHVRTGDTLWLNPEGVVEIWAGELSLAGKLLAWTDSTLVLEISEEEGDSPMPQELTLSKKEVTWLYYWKKHDVGQPFDAERYKARRRRVDHIASAGMASGIALTIAGRGDLGALMALSSLSFHAISRGVANRHWERISFRRRWVWG